MASITLPPPKTFNAELTKCWQVLQGGRTIAVYRSLIDLTGSIKAAVMLSQLIYWTRVSQEVAERDGWIYKTIAQMEEETGLTKREQSLCKTKLEALNLIITSRKNQGGKRSFKVNLNELANAVCGLQGTKTEKGLNIAELQSKSSLFFRRYFSQRLAYHRDLVTLTGCIHSAIMLSQVLQDAVKIYHAHHNRCHAFSTLTIKDWQNKTSLSHKSQLTARNRLKNLDFICEKHFIASRRIFTLVNAQKILQSITQLMKQMQANKVATSNPEKAIFTSLAKRAKKDCTKGQNGENQSLMFDFSTNSMLHPPRYNMTFRSNKRENSEVTNAEIQKLPNGKFTSNKRENSFFRLNNYSIYKYNYIQNTNLVLLPKDSEVIKQDVVVVNEEDLIFPKQIKTHERIQALNIVRKHLPAANRSLIQELLDEIQGMKVEVRNPLGLLHKLALSAKNGTFIAINSPSVQYNREQIAKRKLKEKQELEAKRLNAMKQNQIAEQIDNAKQNTDLLPQSMLQEKIATLKEIIRQAELNKL